MVVGTLTELGFQIRSTFTSFGTATVRICTCPLAEVAVDAPEVVRGVQQGLIQEVIDMNADAVGGRFTVSVRPDAKGGSCEVSLVVSPVTRSGWCTGTTAANNCHGPTHLSQA